MLCHYLWSVICCPALLAPRHIVTNAAINKANKIHAVTRENSTNKPCHCIYVSYCAQSDPAESVSVSSGSQRLS